MKNIIDAISTLVKNNNFKLNFSSNRSNRVNSLGDALEIYTKNLFADTFDCSETERLEIWSKIFSYLGNSANPPDFMLKNGDAIEVKKIESPDSNLALNSSYPKHILKSSSELISSACRNCEDWTEKDILYVVGVVDRSNKLKNMCMVYGKNYCASDECYERIRQRIKYGVETIPQVEFSKTRELGRVNRVDPLGITYLRVRGMWHIENPWQVFNYVYKRNFQAKFNFMCIIDYEKWSQLENIDELVKLRANYPALKVFDIKIKNPDNPCKLINAKLINYEV